MLFCSILPACISQCWTGQNPKADITGKKIVCLDETGEKTIFCDGQKEGQIKKKNHVIEHYLHFFLIVVKKMASYV